MKKALVALLLLAATSSAQAKENPWTLADLEAAAKEGQWLEALEHLGDVNPSARDARWKKVADEVAMGFLEYCAKQEDPLSALFMGEAILMRFPSVRKSRAIMTKRAEIGMKGFESCFQRSYGGGECGEALVRFVDGDAGNSELAMSAGKLVRRNQNHYAATPMFVRAVSWGKKKKATLCKDADLSMAVIAGLGLPGDYALAKDARALADTCFDELKKTIVAELKPDSGGYYTDNACVVLNARKTPAKACDATQARK